MFKFKVLVSFIVLSYFSNLFSQENYEPIDRYDCYVPIICKDSVRWCNKRLCNGNITDYYPSGKILHKAYYTQGLILNGFENYFENGSLERKFKPNGTARGTMKTFYPNGKIRSEREYYKTQIVCWKDYYENGNLEYIEEYDGKAKYLKTMNSYYENGLPESKLELVDAKKRLYKASEYYENGNIKEQGHKIYIEDKGGHVKHGKWEYYDENGKLIEVINYYKGREDNEE